MISSSDNVSDKLKGYRRIVLPTEGFSKPFFAKTGMSLLRYRGEDVLAILIESYEANASHASPRTVIEHEDDGWLYGGELHETVESSTHNDHN